MLRVGETRKPKIRIEIETPELPFYPGETVHGRAIVSNPRPDLVESLELSFFGGVTVETARTTKKTPGPLDRVGLLWESRCLILYESRKLTERKLESESGSVVFDFELKLPLRCPDRASLPGALRGYVPYWKSAAGFNVLPGQPLPPSCRKSKVDLWSMFRSCSVKYEVTVKSKQSLGASQEIRVLPFPYTLENGLVDTPSNVVVKSYRLGRATEEQARRLSMRQATKTLMNSKDTPSISLTVHTLTPKRLIIGDTFTMSVMVEPNFSSSTVDTMPELQLQRIEVELVSFVQARSKGVFNIEEVGDATFSEWQIAEDFSPEEGTLHKGNEYRVTHRCKQPLPRKLPPSFSTYTVKITHRLEIKWVLLVQGEKQTRSRVVPAMILPPKPAKSVTAPENSEPVPDYVPTAPSKAEEAGNPQGHYEAEDELPAYQP